MKKVIEPTPIVTITIGVYPDAESDESILVQSYELLGKEYSCKPDSLMGAVIHGVSKTQSDLRERLWEKYPKGGRR
jgi:hypothetical protein